MRRFAFASVFLCLLLATCALGIGSAAAERGDHELPNHKERDVCTAQSHDFDDDFGHDFGRATAACHAEVVTELDGVSPLATTSYVNGYAPSDLASAYRLPTGAGSGVTVAIVDAYDNPSAYADLTAYRSRFGLPPCTDTSGCFRKVNQNGLAAPLPQGNTGWGQEIDLDIEMVSAACPQCNILLVEANSNNFTDLGAAVNRAAAMGAAAISNSYGTSSEFSGETSYDSYYNHPNIAITASSGDSGYGVEFPAASSHVVAVGGTSLVADGSARGWSESAWSGAGSGCSSFFAKPSWQTDSGCSRRTEADVSAVANPSTGVAVYDSYGSGGGANWYVFGGTSVSAPIIASVFALAGSATSVDYPARLLYANPGGLFDVSGGSNGSCSTAYLCNALSGYDGPTGLGSPNGIAAFTAAPPAPDFSLTVSPASNTVTQGASAAYTVNLNPTGGFANSVNLSASGLPIGAAASFNPTPTTGSSTLTVSTISTLAPQSYPFTITGSDGSLTHSVQATLVVQQAPVPDFSISISPSSRKINSSGTTTYTVTISPVNGFSAPVTLSASGFPSGLTGSFSPNPATSTSTLTLTASRLRRHTQIRVTIKGASGSLSHSTNLSLTVS